MKISTVPLFYTRAKKDDTMLTREIAIKQATDFVLDCFKIEVHHFNSDYYKKGDPFINEINATGFEVKW
jgi:hypothetical protein